MADKRSNRRFEGHPTYRSEPAEGPAVELYEPRFSVARPPRLLHRVAAGERLDLLAHRYFGDPQRTHAIVDQNPTLDPESLLEPGRRIGVGEE